MELTVHNPLNNTVPTPRCSLCFNYLNQGGTVMLSPSDGSPVCGRCLSSMAADSKAQYITTSLYNELVGLFAFKCINHFSGCKFVVIAAEDHELECPEQIAACPICAFVGNGCQLEYHFEAHHNEFLIKDKFTIKNENGFISTFLYMKKDAMFALFVVIESDVLKIKAVNILKNPALRNYRIELSCNFDRSIYSDIGNFQEKKDLPTYLKVDLYKLTKHFTKPKIYAKIEVIDPDFNEYQLRKEINTVESKLNELKKEEIELDTQMEQLQDEYNRISNTIAKIESSNSMQLLEQFTGIITPLMTICSSCKICVDSSNYKICLNNHIVCEICQTNIECKACERHSEFRPPPVILNEFQFQCQWVDCDQTTSFHHFLLHKQECAKRLYTCLDVECRQALRYNEFIHHWHFIRP